MTEDVCDICLGKLGTSKKYMGLKLEDIPPNIWINFKNPSNVVVGRCGHKFHDDCIQRWLNANDPGCPFCSKDGSNEVHPTAEGSESGVEVEPGINKKTIEEENKQLRKQVNILAGAVYELRKEQTVFKCALQGKNDAIDQLRDEKKTLTALGFMMARTLHTFANEVEGMVGPEMGPDGRVVCRNPVPAQTNSGSDGGDAGAGEARAPKMRRTTK